MRKERFCHDWQCNGKPVTLPHDAMVHETRNPNAACGSAGAFFPGGTYVYEKTFRRPDAEHVLFQFEGVYKNARVTINGHEAGGTAYGYLPFFVDADPFLTDGENVITVSCECSDQPDSRWYTGAGIYRPVWMWTGPKDSIPPESVMITTVSWQTKTIHVQSAEPIVCQVMGVKGEGTDFTLTLSDAELWSEDTPVLYTMQVSNGQDSEEISFGIRQIEWSPKGLFINGKETLLRGGCVHHDNGILGAASWDESEERRVRMMKAAGYNAIRSSHNPASRAMLEACDRLGVYMMDEAWDMWYSHKSRYDYAGQWKANYLHDLETIVRRDFNHPSVILYSVGNEVSEPAKPEGVEVLKEMVSYLHRMDPSRPVTGGFNLMILSRSAKGKGIYDENGEGRDDSADKKMSGMNSTMFNLIASMVGTGMNKAANSKKADTVTTPALDALDIAGYNYASGRYPLEGKAHPERIIFGSETFPQDLARNWEMVKQYPYLIGDFMWTAWDYLGEAGIGAWAYTEDGKGFSKPYPWLLADTGAMDILGDPNGELFWASAVWGKLNGPAICVQPVNHDKKPARGTWRGTNSIPSWSWKGCDGKKAVVEVFTDAAAVDLILNGKKIGHKTVKQCRAVFKVPYQSGKLEAVALDLAGSELSRSVLTSAQSAVHASALPEKQAARSGEVVYVPILMTDSQGVVESNADETLSVAVENGELLGFGSANPRTEESFVSGSYTTYYGRALAIVRCGKAGKTVVRVQGKSGGATAEISVNE